MVRESVQIDSSTRIRIGISKNTKGFNYDFAVEAIGRDLDDLMSIVEEVRSKLEVKTKEWATIMTP